ncbi:MAG: RHS repeat-associated core domain-containing protein [Clostridia bacterium]|nr:RHS repeat-associated core domain-containing protein [Clostridia bacterium]
MQDKRCFTYPWFVLDNIVLFSDDCTSAWQTFWYEKNLQGDVVAVYSHDGVKLVSYAYDAWGNTTTTYHNGGASTGARYNPIRYRGYYYDSDLGMYWLQTRLYNPTLRRFMSPDSFVSTGQGFVGYNMYAYCGNDPVNRVDYSGEFWMFALSLIVKIVVVAVLVAHVTITYSSCEGRETVSTPEEALDETKAEFKDTGEDIGEIVEDPDTKEENIHIPIPTTILPLQSNFLIQYTNLLADTLETDYASFFGNAKIDRAQLYGEILFHVIGWEASGLLRNSTYTADINIYADGHVEDSRWYVNGPSGILAGGY